MDIRQLENFLAVYDELNFAKAAEKRYITRQAIRKSISLLEEEGKTVLFRIERNKLHPTDAADELEKKARKVVRAFNRLEQEFVRTGAPDKAIRVGVDESLYPLAIQIFQPPFQEFRNLFPDCSLIIEDREARDLQAQVSQGQYDFGIMMDTASLMPFEVSASFPLGDLMLFMSKKTRGRGGKVSQMDILDQKKLLLPGKPDDYRWIRKLLEICGEKGIRTDHFEYGIPAEQMVYRVRYEGAVGFGGPTDTLSAPPNTVTVLVPEFPYAPSLCVFRDDKRIMREEERVFAEFLRSAFKGMNLHV